MFGDDFAAEVARGGYTLVVIAALSLLAVAIAVERLVATFGVLADARRLSEQVSRALARGDHAQARSSCERSRALAADLFLAGFAHGPGAAAGSVPRRLIGAVERERVALVLTLKRRLWVLGTIGTISPFVGLFGTVVGIGNAFRSMHATGTGGFAVVAGGLSEALIATAAGIFVAVEAVVLYNFFQARLGRISAELKLLAEEFVELVVTAPAPNAPSAAPDSAAAGS